MELNDQLHAAASLSLWKMPPIPIW